MKKHNQQRVFRKKELAIAVSLAVVGGLSGCSSDSSSSAAALYVITANGGTAGTPDPVDFVANEGGNGGEISLYNYGGTGGVEVSGKGVANTAFTSPIKPEPVDLGDNPLEISNGATIEVVDYNNPIDDAAAGTTNGELYVGSDDIIRRATGATADYTNDPALTAGPYMREDEPFLSHIYIAAAGAAAGHSVVTGLSVAEGATLILGDNDSGDATVSFSHDIDNSGTITKVANGDDIILIANRYLASGSIVNAGTEAEEDGGDVDIITSTGIANSGSINTSGFTEDNDVDENGAVIGDENGGDGGDIRLDAIGYVVNDGALDSSGGDGRLSGGNGGRVDIGSNTAYVENNGAVDASGGSNVNPSTPLVQFDSKNGGDGGNVSLDADFVANNTADINTMGGNGSEGGDGGDIDIDNDEVGEAKNAGALNLNGGMGITEYGGNAGDMDMRAYGGNLLNDGDITAKGGDSSSESTSGTTDGGDGGDLNFYAYDSDDGDTAAGDIIVSGNLDVSGGSANALGRGDGGDSGDIMLDLDPADNGDKIGNQRAALLGYLSIDANGGNSGEALGYGGMGGELDLRADYQYDNSEKVFAGSAKNDVPFTANGGDGGEFGGYGGHADISASTSEDVRELNVKGSNSGDISLNGGSGKSSASTPGYGAFGGELSVSGYHGADNSGDLSSIGGNAVISEGGTLETVGGPGGALGVYSVVNQARNTGDLNLIGGDGGEFGGYGGYADVYGGSAANNGGIAVDGGNATETDEVLESLGGFGGTIMVTAPGVKPAATNTGDVTYTYGTGDINGEEGCLQVGLTFEGNCATGGFLVK